MITVTAKRRNMGARQMLTLRADVLRSSHRPTDCHDAEYVRVRSGKTRPRRMLVRARPQARREGQRGGRPCSLFSATRGRQRRCEARPAGGPSVLTPGGGVELHSEGRETNRGLGAFSPHLCGLVYIRFARFDCSVSSVI